MLHPGREERARQPFSSQQKLELDLILFWETTGPELWDFRLQPTSFSNRSAMCSDLPPSPRSIEINPRSIVVCGHQPQPTTPCSSRNLLSFSKKRGRYILALLQREQDDNFALPTAQAVQKEPHRLPRDPGDVSG
jgi:hypothetical protein